MSRLKLFSSFMVEPQFLTFMILQINRCHRERHESCAQNHTEGRIKWNLFRISIAKSNSLNRHISGNDINCKHFYHSDTKIPLANSWRLKCDAFILIIIQWLFRMSLSTNVIKLSTFLFESFYQSFVGRVVIYNVNLDCEC